MACSLAIAAPAAATTFTETSLDRLTRSSDLVVIGRVEEVESYPSGPGGQPGIHSRATIRVEETLKGERRPIVYAWVHGGRFGDRLRVVPGQATFQQGERVALFLFQAGGAWWPTGMGRGKWTISPDLVVSPGAHLISDASDPLDLNALRAHVMRAALASSGRTAP